LVPPNAFIDGSGKPDPSAGSTKNSLSFEAVHRQQVSQIIASQSQKPAREICGFQDIVKRKHIRMIPDLMSAAMHFERSGYMIMHTSREQA